MLTLKRIAYTDTETAGALILDGFPFLLTLEDPWRDNARFVSCIPKGNYVCKRMISPKFGETFTVIGVPDRDFIRFHWGCTHLDTEGCILTGKKFGKLDGLNAILESKAAFGMFMAKLAGINQINLLVRG